MPNIEDRVVSMKFDNATFEAKAATTLGTLDKLKSKLDFTGNSKGIDDLTNAVGRFNMGGMGASVDGVSAKFIALSTIAITALANITNRAVDAGINLTKAFTIDAGKAGFQEYEQKLGAIQTMMAGSGESLDVVNKKLQELNAYSDKTIYSFADMTQNISKFTNAGVKLDDSVAAIKGVANVAALSGANAEEASRAMYNFGQALSKGYVALIDWKSIELANMGTVEFKQQLIDAAVAAGTLTKGVDGLTRTTKGTIVNTKNFSETLQEQWLSSEALTSSLKDYADSTTDIGKRATDAATQVKTFSQLMGTLKEAAGSGWAATFEILIGDFNEAKELFTGINDVVGGFMTKQANERNKMLEQWKALGGRDDLLAGLKNTFEGLLSVLKPIRDAFRQIFPAQTAQSLAAMTKSFREFTEGLTISGQTADQIKRTFAGVFAIFSIGWQIIKRVVALFFDLGSSAATGDDGLLAITATIGDFLVAVDNALKKGSALNKVFSALGDILSIPITILGGIGKLLTQLFDGMGGGVGVINGIATAFEWLGKAIGEAINPDNVNLALSGITAGMLLGIYTILKTFINRISSLFSGGLFGRGGFIDSIKDSFQSLTGALQSMQTLLQAKTLQAIAVAVVLLAASMVAMSLVDPDRLGQALGSMTFAFANLLAAMAILVKVSGSAGFIAIPLIAGSMVALATAVLILSAAMKVMASMSWEEILKGLVGVGALLAGIVVTSRLLQGSAPSMLAAGAAMIPLATGIAILAGAMKLMATMNWEEIGKGLVGIAGALLIIAGAMQLMPPTLPITAAGLVLVAASLGMIAKAVKSFASMKWGEMGKGMAGLAGALLIIAGAMQVMPANLPLTAAGLVLVSIALQGITRALKGLSGMSWEEIGKGLVALGGALLILAVGLNAMSGAILGAVALTVAAAGLALLVPLLIALGQMSWESIGKGLAALAGALLIIGVAGLLIAPIVPALIGLGAAVLLLGAGMALAGVGMLAFVAGLTALVALGAAAGQAIGNLLGPVIDMIPVAIAALGQGLIAFMGVIVANAPAIGAAMLALLNQLINVVIQAAPRMGQMFLVLINTGLTVLVAAVPRIAAAGIRIILGLLTAMSNNIGKIVDVVTKLIINFINALAKNTPKMVDAGVKAIIKFIDGMARAIDNNSKQLGEAGARLGMAIIKGMVKAISGAAGQVATAVKNAAGGAIKAGLSKLGIGGPSKEFMKQGDSIGLGLIMGMEQRTKGITSAAGEMATKSLNAFNKTIGDISSLTDDMDTAPRITPVLDLSKVKQDAPKMNSLFNGPTLDAELSYNRASGLANDVQAAKDAESEAADQDKPTKEIKFEQNISSPKPLDEVEVYRNTKSLIALAKEEINA